MEKVFKWVTAWELRVLNVWFDYDSGAAVGLSAGVLGMVELVSVYVQVVFVGEVGFSYEHYVDLLVF